MKFMGFDVKNVKYSIFCKWKIQMSFVLLFKKQGRINLSLRKIILFDVIETMMAYQAYWKRRGIIIPSLYFESVKKFSVTRLLFK